MAGNHFRRGDDFLVLNNDLYSDVAHGDSFHSMVRNSAVTSVAWRHRDRRAPSPRAPSLHQSYAGDQKFPAPSTRATCRSYPVGKARQ
ncbi:hypothetical protein [Mycobacteroides abscessus]|uniref:Uncharacterized protein n=2 Tax=Mycobacteroides abscessus TaxID=36809 RepID=A0A829PMN4_9MYCO|nr:hypothetical protein [Mycobacteroides abscessus]ETZ70789.1 hypothetical protein L835_3712 [Mycobacteroides abscessus MAB_110811_1470]ETZ88162.1 hypothetical protein L829_1718 [Mycobacteroides abscessus MAB_030201_1075]ETZ94790.1 hypothetical protein L828_3795 [Mycobacteroides abscessus MAB_030201_1061]AWG66341.1 hypothetical protein DDT46_22825 [Mycobacteroides abscessus]MBN7385417.1 hypothetical protein [Mycobacteroides abscessus subsp. abscessus]